MELTLDRLTRRFGEKVAVRDISAQLGCGVYGLLGPNGAGKTTLLRMLADVLAPSGGSILADGAPVAAQGEVYRARLGYLPQHFGYYPGFTAMDFMLYMAAVKGLARPLAAAEAAQLLEKVRLAHVRDKKIRTFSGGMRQRLGIAQAMLGSPDLLLLDEPTAGLDPKERIFFRNMLAEYAEGRTVLLSTHIVADVESIATEVLVMKQGGILHSGAPQDILRAVEGRVWECRLPLREAESLALRCPPTSFRHEGGDAFLRVVCGESPAPGAVQATPNLEDLYMFYFAEEVADDGTAGAI